MLLGVGVGVMGAGVVGAAGLGLPVTVWMVFSAPGAGVFWSKTIVPPVGTGVGIPVAGVLPVFPQSFQPPPWPGVGVGVEVSGKIFCPCCPWVVCGVSTTTVSGVMVTVAVGCSVWNGRLFPELVSPPLFTSSGGT